MRFNGVAHPHSFLNGGSEKHTAGILPTRQGLRLSAGIKDLLILKTTDSGFENYIKDQYTTLKETADRIFSTECTVSWIYESVPADPEEMYSAVRENLLLSFATHKSLSVQHTLYAMGENVLKAFPLIKEISLKCRTNIISPLISNNSAWIITTRCLSPQMNRMDLLRGRYLAGNPYELL